jgi:hypothetical protein
MPSPFTTKLFAPSGAPDGVLVASRDDWPGRAIIFPRVLVGEVKGRKEYVEPGVYLLVGAHKMYIGEGDPVGDRIDRHVAEKDFWRRGLIFTAEGRRLNKAHIQHLESRLVGIAKQAGRTVLDNGNNPQPPALSEEDHAFCENFLQQMLMTLPLLGFWQFASELEVDEEEEVEDDDLEDKALAEALVGKRARLYASLPQGLEFKLQTKGITATLVISENGVLLKKDSQVVKELNPSFELRSPSYAALRRQLQEAGILVEVDTFLRFTQDQFFSSGSAAAAVVRGGPSNGNWWKDASGKNLGDYIREAKSQP